MLWLGWHLTWHLTGVCVHAALAARFPLTGYPTIYQYVAWLGI